MGTPTRISKIRLAPSHICKELAAMVQLCQDIPTISTVQFSSSTVPVWAIRQATHTTAKTTKVMTYTSSPSASITGEAPSRKQALRLTDVVVSPLESILMAFHDASAASLVLSKFLDHASHFSTALEKGCSCLFVCFSVMILTLHSPSQSCLLLTSSLMHWYVASTICFYLP